MTINWRIADFEVTPLLQLKDEMLHFHLDWVSHGNFAVHCDKTYLSFEPEHFQQILDAYSNAPKPSHRTPFWTGTIPRHGMMLSEELLEAFACQPGPPDYIKFTRSDCDLFGRNVPFIHSQAYIDVETFKKMTQAAQESSGRRMVDRTHGNI